MSTKYPGGIISKTAPTPSGPYSTDTAPGIWTLEQQAYWQKLGQWPTAGNYNPSLFIENLFSTYLYTGNGTSQSIVNGIDLSTYGGLVWTKSRSNTYWHEQTDTVRGPSIYVSSNSTNAQNSSQPQHVTAFNSNGFSVGTELDVNASGATFASWTFRKQPKFFDVVTYTGNGVAGRTIAHSLGSVPGCIIVKNLTTSGTAWEVYHRSLGNTKIIELNSTAAAQVQNEWNNTDPTSTVFSVYSGYGTNFNGDQYVAYLFAHDAGGFGLSGSDNVISCGSYTGAGSPYTGGSEVTLGYEPQWLLIKRADTGTANWVLLDNMRGLTADGTNENWLYPNLSDAEGTSGTLCKITATGFKPYGSSLTNNTGTYIYIAIRRGPMKVPTSGTSVFSPLAVNNLVNTVNTTNFPIDLQWYGNRNGDTLNITTVDRLRGVSSTGTQQQNYLCTTSTAAEVTTGGSNVTNTWNNTGFKTASLQDGADAAYWNFQRAPSFFDEVCYTGGSGAQTVPHNLGVAPELIIIKSRSLAGTTPGWPVYTASGGVTKYLSLNTTDAQTTFAPFWGGTAPTSTNFYLGGYAATNNTGDTYVAYLFATCAGVSKVGSYTGTGTTLQVDCGFTGGARFVMIKRTDSTGDWYVWDSARGIVAGNDPYLLMNSTAAEVTGTDYVDTYNAGFEISSTAPSAINASGGTFIFLAIA